MSDVLRIATSELIVHTLHERYHGLLAVATGVVLCATISAFPKIITSTFVKDNLQHFES